MWIVWLFPTAARDWTAQTQLSDSEIFRKEYGVQGIRIATLYEKLALVCRASMYMLFAEKETAKMELTLLALLRVNATKKPEAVDLWNSMSWSLKSHHVSVSRVNRQNSDFRHRELNPGLVGESHIS